MEMKSDRHMTAAGKAGSRNATAKREKSAEGIFKYKDWHNGISNKCDVHI